MASPILWRLNDVSVCCWHRGDDGISGLLHILRSKTTRTCWTGFVDLCKWISGTRWEVDFWRARLQISLSAGFWQIIGCGILGGGHKTQRPEISGGRRQRLYARTSPMVVWAAASLQSWSSTSAFYSDCQLSSCTRKHKLNMWGRYLVEQQPSLKERSRRKWVIWELSNGANSLCFFPPK